MIKWKKSFDSAYVSIAYDQVNMTLSESQAEMEELNQSQSMGMCIVIGLSFCRPSNPHNLVFTRSWATES